jgi:hypothetical protein
MVPLADTYKNGAAKDKKRLHVAVLLPSGLGNALISFAWVQKFLRDVPTKICIDLYAPSHLAKYLCTDISFVDTIYNKALFPITTGYDLKLRLSHFVEVASFNMANISFVSSQLAETISKWFLFSQTHGKYIKRAPQYDGAWAKLCGLMGWNRWSELGASGGLAFSEQDIGLLPVPKNENEILRHLKLAAGQYITVHTGASAKPSQRQTKNWPLSHWEKFCSLLKEQRPDILLVQIGTADNHNIRGVDLNLSGKTTLESLAVVLKNARLHVDEDSGLVQMRHLLHGKSVVLFGPTVAAYTGLPGNVNLVSPICSGCLGLENDWKDKCVLRYETSRSCLEALPPSLVAKEVFKCLNVGFHQGNQGIKPEAGFSQGVQNG